MWVFSIEKFVEGQDGFSEFLEPFDGEQVIINPDGMSAHFKNDTIGKVNLAGFDIYPKWCRFVPDKKGATD